MADLTRLYNFVAGTPAVADQVDAEFDQLIARINALEADSFGNDPAEKLGLSQTGVVRRGKSIIAAAESTSATSYAIGNLATPDRVQNVVLPADGLICVAYQAIWQNTVAQNARIGLFLGANQVKAASGTGAPVVIEENGPSELNDDGVISMGASGFDGLYGAGASTEVTTGQVIGANNNNSPVFYIFAAAGTYDVSVQFKNNVAGSLTVKNRKLWVWTLGF